MRTVRAPISSLREHPNNPRRGDLEAIKESLARHGQYLPLVVNRPTMQVLRGNHTLKAARALGWSEIDIYLIEVEEETATRILLADNRLADRGGYDSEELAALLRGLEGDFAGTGYEQADLDGLLAELSDLGPLAEDELPPLPRVPVTRPGELVELGPHRLVCGDARDPSCYRLLFGQDERAGVLWTDPPYGVGYTGRTAARLRLRGDEAETLRKLLPQAFAQADVYLAAGAAVYVCHPAGPLAALFLEATAERWLLRQGLVWVKDSFVVGHGDYQYGHEPILYAAKPGAGRFGRSGERWFGGHAQSSVLAVPRPRASRDHPTAKPAELVAIALRNSSRPGEIVLDPFAGSGSTMVAAEQLARRAFLIELDPCYCDVVVARYEHASGRPVRRTKSG